MYVRTIEQVATSFDGQSAVEGKQRGEVNSIGGEIRGPVERVRWSTISFTVASARFCLIIVRWLANKRVDELVSIRRAYRRACNKLQILIGRSSR